MAEYIERRKVIFPLYRWKNIIKNTYGENDEYVRCLIEAIEKIEDVPSADVLPVRHGRWIFKADSSWSGGGKYECSACKYGYAIGSYHEPDEFTYCPHCGAYMMDGGKE